MQEKQTKLWHTTFYDSEVKLKQLYVKICRRLPAHTCKLYDIKELLHGNNTVKKVAAVGVCSARMQEAGGTTFP